jgi:hypothetical protein
MLKMMRAISLMLAAFVLAGGVASAEGVTRVQQADGAVQVYPGVNIRLAGETLWLRTPDRKGVLEVASGACSFVGQLQRCLAVTTTLHQHGKTHQIALDRGTVYMNLTDTVQHMPHSSQQLASHAVVVHLHTARGTFISVKGTLDAVK